jgi:hypothetical protein
MSIDYSNSEKSLQHALTFQALGFPVFPIHSIADGVCTCERTKCSDPAKHPLTAHGFKDASLDPGKINAWHQQFLEQGAVCNWAIATGNGVGVLDVDPRHGGNESLALLEQEHGPLPLTFAVTTGGGGRHLYFKGKFPSKSHLKPGLDTRGEGGYVLIPPSLHASGGRYALASSWDTPLAECPAWLLDLAAPAAKPVTSGNAIHCSGLTLNASPALTLTIAPDLSNHPGAGEGERNAMLCRLVGIHLARGEALADVEALALAWAGRCHPPLPEAKASDTVRRLGRKEQAKAEANDQSSQPSACQSPILRLASPSDPALRQASWPTLHPDALHGLAGDIIKAISPETEADPAAVLLAVLVGFGSAVGRSPCFRVGVERHGANLFGLLVGDTACRSRMGWAMPGVWPWVWRRAGGSASGRSAGV